MAVKNYDSMVSKVLPIDVEVPEQSVPTNYYPHYVMGKSTKIAEKDWNTNHFTMDYYVFEESNNRECGYPEKVGARFRIYQGGDYVATCSVGYNCDTGAIISFEIKIPKDTITVQATDIEEFINQVIMIFGILALNELLKLNENNGDSLQPEHLPPTHGDYSSGRNGKSSKHPTKKYVVSSWQKHGYYKTNGIYIKSSICQRNTELLAT